MADGTLQILSTPDGAAPVEYNVVGNATLDLLAVKADFDGSGAGSDFVPVVEIVSPAGRTMGDGVGSTITAGDSASVTFAPFLRGASGGTPATPIVVNRDLYTSGGNLSLTAGNAGALQWAYNTGTQFPTQILDTTNPAAPTATTGLYFLEIQIFPTGALNANKTFGVETLIGSGFSPYDTSQASVPVPAAYLDPNGNRQGVLYTVQWPVRNNGEAIQIFVINGDTATRAFFIGHVNVVQVTGMTIN